MAYKKLKHWFDKDLAILLECWSCGVLDEHRAAEQGSCMSADRNVIICSVQEIGTLHNQGGASKSF